MTADPARSNPRQAPDAQGHWLSDLADGRLDDAAIVRGCAAWAADPEARRTWHAYHLIGDVLRSDDLASAPAADAAFLAALRRRLGAEPVVLAPARSRRLHRLWWRPMVAAAGFVAVAGVVVVLRQADPAATAGPLMASQGGVVLPVAAVGTKRQPAPVSAGQMLRDARVDEYLRAHREPLAGSPVALPGGAMRSVDFELSTR
jgi:sigma-E factor negative regulatory protein RseA